jgi:hypothetical protein
VLLDAPERDREGDMRTTTEAGVDETVDLFRELVKSALVTVYAVDIAAQRALDAVRDVVDELIATSADSPPAYVLMVEPRLEALADRLEAGEHSFESVLALAREVEGLVELAAADAGNKLADS